ncbi:hypothetical protein BD310DRAFT_384445 [Dichomitus squalens]|uniref:Uncharacterized protein n=1 Tax=Dichomitus squalens TaxID=114155 RepID=A0A4Q9PY95_9APHY|nr:hypothetical protein BD310DRAFT_384445 [Dichomitus squalens]
MCSSTLLCLAAMVRVKPRSVVVLIDLSDATCGLLCCSRVVSLRHSLPGCLRCVGVHRRPARKAFHQWSAPEMAPERNLDTAQVGCNHLLILAESVQ